MMPTSTPPALLKLLKDLHAKAATGAVNVASLDSRGNQLQLQTTKPALAIAFFRNRANADYAAAAWTWLPRLIEEIERLMKLFPPESVVTLDDGTKLTMPTIERREFNVQAISESHRPRVRRQPRARKRAPVE
jgi:hypothetical protein